MHASCGVCTHCAKGSRHTTYIVLSWWSGGLIRPLYVFIIVNGADFYQDPCMTVNQY
jgi:hypothetical protein